MSAEEVQKQIDGNEPILTRLEIACNLLREMNLLQEVKTLPASMDPEGEVWPVLLTRTGVVMLWFPLSKSSPVGPEVAGVD